MAGSGHRSGEQCLTCAAVPRMCHSCQDEATWGHRLYKHEATQDGQTYLIYKRKAKSHLMEIKKASSYKWNE